MLPARELSLVRVVRMAGWAWQEGPRKMKFLRQRSAMKGHPKQTSHWEAPACARCL